jgi:hypothetical protein
MMKPIKSTLSLLLLLGLMTSTVAKAEGRGHFYGGFRGPHVGVFVDPLLLFYPFAYSPYGYYPYGYYPQVVVTEPAAPIVYMEQGTPAQDSAQQPSQATSPSSDWYYCRKPEGYYPYVRSCPNGWQRVPAQPPTQR